jgi:hypothetical protein
MLQRNESAGHSSRALDRGVYGVDKLENVLERLGDTESTKLALTRDEVGKIRVTSSL